MKRYLLFSGEDYYPIGGWKDFDGSYDSIEEAITRAKNPRDRFTEWFHIVDSMDATVVHEDTGGRTLIL